MSRGPGRIEHAIRELLDAHPDLAFVTDELVEHCYPGITEIERKHQVSVLRAAQGVVASDPDWTASRGDGQGGTWVFHNRANVQSVAMADVIGGFAIIYRSKSRTRRNELAWRHANQRTVLDWLPRCRVIEDRTAALKDISHNALISCAKRAAWHVAYRDGDVATKAAMDAKKKSEQDAWMASVKAMFGKPSEKVFPSHPTNGKATLTRDALETLASRIRALMVENDPDVLRAGLAAVAAELDAQGGAQ
jgi:hypothetical protein